RLLRFLYRGCRELDFAKFLFQHPAQLFLRGGLVTGPENAGGQIGAAFSGRLRLQQLPGAALCRVAQVGPENELRPFHPCASSPQSATTARSYPWALTRSSRSVTVRHRPSLGRMWRVTTDAPPPIMTTGNAW